MLACAVHWEREQLGLERPPTGVYACQQSSLHSHPTSVLVTREEEMCDLGSVRPGHRGGGTGMGLGHLGTHPHL